jgi:HEAT repeat protein
MRTTLLALALYLCLAPASAPAAHAQELSVAEATEHLGSSDPAAVRTGIEALGLAGNARAVPPLADRIRRGLPPELLDAALDTLLVLSRPESGPILFELTAHRRPEVRLKAVQAIVASEPRGADRVLVSALSDLDPAVRAAAALGLGQLGARTAIDPLFHALDRGVAEASTAIGQLATAEQVTRLLGYLGRIPFDALTPALSEILARRDVPQRTKLDVIARLEETATPEAKAFLQEFVASLPEPPRRGRPDPVRQAAEEAILRIAG